MMMQRTLLGLMLMMGLAFAGACGGDDKDGDDGGSSASGGEAASGGTMEVVMCGGETCMGAPGFAEACCDETAGKCGALFQGVCTSLPDPDERCPVATGLVADLFPSCCQEDTNLCGVLNPLDMTCTDLNAAAQVAMQFGGLVSIPAPVDCDGNAVEPMTGGMDASGGDMGTGGDDEDAGI